MANAEKTEAEDPVPEDGGGAELGDATETLPLAARARPYAARGGHPAFYPGELVAGRFTIVGDLGRGGMGEVYEAIDQDLGERVALKTLHPGDEDHEPLRARFRQEILLARQVTHPNVCRIFDLCHHVTRDRGRLPLLSMELLEGETLSTRLRRDGALPPAEVRRLAAEIARALAAAHEVGVVHCDLKSGNVMLVPGKRGSRAVVMDFGLASTSSGHGEAAGPSSGSSGSRADTRTAGTPGYMAPELKRGEPATPAADLYSLGIVIREMLTGESPRRPSSNGADDDRGADHPAIDAAWKPLLARCLHPDPARRFAAAEDLARELTGDADRRRRRRLAVAGGIAAAAVAAALVGLTARRPANAPAAGEPPAPQAAMPETAAARLYAEGLAGLDAFRAHDAVSKLEAAVAADPDFLLARIALVRAKVELGELRQAADEAHRALELDGGELDGGLPREIRLTLEALAAEAEQDWEAAHSRWNALATFYPDEVEYGLGAIRALVEAWQGADALKAVESLRRDAPHLDGDPRLDLAEARAAGQCGAYDRQLEAARRATEKAARLESPVLEARALLEAAAALRVTRSMDEALAAARRARRRFEEVGQRSGVAEALLAEANCLRDLGQADDATARAEEALAIYRDLGHRRGVADAMRRLADGVLSTSPSQARELYQQAHDEYVALGNQIETATMIHNIGLTYFREEVYDRAVVLFRESLLLSRQLKDLSGEAVALNSLGVYQYYVERDLPAAMATLELSLAIRRRIHDRRSSVLAFFNLGNIYVRTGELAKAETNYAEALELAMEVQRTSLVASTLRGQARVEVLRGRLAEAEATLRRALGIREHQLAGADDSHERWVLVDVYLAAGRTDGAGAEARRLLAAPTELARQRGRLARAEALTQAKDVDAARAELAAVTIGGDNEDWTEVDLRRRLLAARHLELAGRRQEALAAVRAAAEVAARQTFKALELEARVAACALAAEDVNCFEQIRKQAHGLGFALLVKRLDDIRGQ